MLSEEEDRKKVLESQVAQLRKLESKVAYFMDDEQKASKEYRDFSEELLNKQSIDLLPQIFMDDANTLLALSKDEGNHYNYLDNLLMKIGNKITEVQVELDNIDKILRESSSAPRVIKESKWKCTSSRWHEYDEFDSKKNAGHCTICDQWINEETGNVLKPSTESAPKKYRKEDAFSKFLKKEETEDTLTYEGMTRRIMNLAGELHNLVYSNLKTKNPTFDEETLQKWSSVTVSEHARWVNMDVHNMRFLVSKDTYDVYVQAGGPTNSIGNLKTITAQDMFNAM